jgi:hypothetical protein
VEFIQYDDALKQIAEIGVREQRAAGEKWRRFVLTGKEPCRHVALGCAAERTEGAGCHLNVNREKLPERIEMILHRLRLSEVLVIPFAPWRKVFDAVAFSLADNRAWQEVDATASVLLNTHDPLRCEPGDFHTLQALIQALLKDADSPDQAITISATRTPLLIEVLPEGRADVSIGKAAIAQELIGELSARA